jgi:hypothetical protein
MMLTTRIYRKEVNRKKHESQEYQPERVHDKYVGCQRTESCVLRAGLLTPSSCVVLSSVAKTAGSSKKSRRYHKMKTLATNSVEGRGL